MANDTAPCVTRRGFLDMQVCVPKLWSDDDIKRFADIMNPCGTQNGWSVRKEGDKNLQGDPERNPCEKRQDFIHVVLDA